MKDRERVNMNTQDKGAPSRPPPLTCARDCDTVLSLLLGGDPAHLQLLGPVHLGPFLMAVLQPDASLI